MREAHKAGPQVGQRSCQALTALLQRLLQQRLAVDKKTVKGEDADRHLDLHKHRPQIKLVKCDRKYLQVLYRLVDPIFVHVLWV